jgi:hypothetical protein
MTTNKLIIAIIFFAACLQTFGQHLGLTFQDAIKQGLTIQHLDSIYKSAVHVDTSQAVFKTEAEQNAVYESYVKMLQDFGIFLTANNFNWEKPTKCFNKIYFSSDGTIDYFLYCFTTSGIKAESQLSQEKQAEFNRLLNLFIFNYKFPLTAKTKFAQCSPATYMPKE